MIVSLRDEKTFLLHLTPAQRAWVDGQIHASRPVIRSRREYFQFLVNALREGNFDAIRIFTVSAAAHDVPGSRTISTRESADGAKTGKRGQVATGADQSARALPRRGAASVSKRGANSTHAKTSTEA
jgi:hypothetical protein